MCDWNDKMKHVSEFVWLHCKQMQQLLFCYIFDKVAAQGVFALIKLHFLLHIKKATTQFGDTLILLDWTHPQTMQSILCPS